MLDELRTIAAKRPWEVRPLLIAFIKEKEKQAGPKKLPRTLSQNSALHVNFDILADKLNMAGFDQRKVLKETVDIPWTREAIKEQLWKPVMESMFGHTSTTELSAGHEITEIHDTLMRHLGEKFGIEYHDFPSQDGKVKNNTQINV